MAKTDWNKYCKNNFTVDADYYNLCQKMQLVNSIIINAKRVHFRLMYGYRINGGKKKYYPMLECKTSNKRVAIPMGHMQDKRDSKTLCTITSALNSEVMADLAYKYELV